MLTLGFVCILPVSFQYSWKYRKSAFLWHKDKAFSLPALQKKLFILSRMCKNSAFVSACDL